MTHPARGILGLVVAAVALVGCVAIYPGTARPSSLEELRRDEGWILLDSVPFVAQVTEQGCGAACLAMVLGHWGDASRAEDLERECGVPGEEGLRASALRDAAKRRGLSAFLFQGSLEDLHHELERGRPVVVGVVKPRGNSLSAHFVVVVGLHPRLGRIAALDPGIGLTSDTVAGFEDEWRPTKGVTLVMFLPEAASDRTVGDARTGGGGR